jgi:hypothetical protein
MPDKKKRHFPLVGVSDELRSQAGRQFGEAITVLRTSGADFWHCGRPVRPSHPANLVMEVTAVGTRLGFVHASTRPVALPKCEITAPTGGQQSEPPRH